MRPSDPQEESLNHDARYHEGDYHSWKKILGL